MFSGGGFWAVEAGWSLGWWGEALWDGRCRGKVGELLLSGGGAGRRTGGVWDLSVGTTRPRLTNSGEEKRRVT